jgi:hypothetical protein
MEEDTIATGMADADSFRTAIEDLTLNQSSLADTLSTLGDRREFKTILRSIQRMVNGEARVSGEMQAIVTLLGRERSRALRLVQSTEWKPYGNDGGLTATIQDVALALIPQNRGRWMIHAQYVGGGAKGYSPAMPHWRGNLDDAKIRAVLAVEETLDHMEEIKAGRR